MRPVNAWAVLLPVVLAVGCASTAPPKAPKLPEGATPSPVAVLPLEDLSGVAGAGERLTRVVYTQMAADGRWVVEEPGETDGALAEARVRSTAVMTREQSVQLAEVLQVRWLLTGTLIEYGSVRTPDGDVPAVGLALRLLDGRTGRVVWADQRYRSGEDRETIFAWGRITDPSRLASNTVTELVHAIRVPAASDTTAGKVGAP